MNESNLPTRQECFDIIREYHVPSNILSNSLALAKLAVFLAKKLKERGIIENIDQVDRAVCCTILSESVILRNQITTRAHRIIVKKHNIR